MNWGHQPGDEATTRVVDFVFEHRDWWTLHGWFHVENTDGVFAPFNPNPDWDPL